MSENRCQGLCLHCGGPVHPLERCPPARKPMTIEGRTFALTGAQVLELAGLCEYAAAALEWQSGVDSFLLLARHWRDHLRREHAAHFGEDV